jgi:hypothetical protein
LSKHYRITLEIEFINGNRKKLLDEFPIKGSKNMESFVDAVSLTMREIMDCGLIRSYSCWSACP